MCIAKTSRRRENIVLPTTAILAKVEPILSSSPNECERVLPTELVQSHLDLVHSNPELVQSTIDPPPKVVQHHYVDHAVEAPSVEDLEYKPISKGGVISPFPIKLYEMLENVSKDNFHRIVSWQPHGRCFLVHKPKDFVDFVLPKYFQQRKYASFQRQLNLYGFNRITQGPDKGCYYHDCFLRGRKYLCHRMQRMKVKGTLARMASNPTQEPNFYNMPQLEESTTQDDDVVLFEGKPFHYIDLPDADKTLNREYLVLPLFNPNASWVTDDDDDDSDNSSLSNDANMDLLFSDLSALVDLTRLDCSDAKMYQILEQIID